MPPASVGANAAPSLFSEDVICDTDGRIGIVTRVGNEPVEDVDDDFDEPPVPDGAAQVCWLESEEPVVLPIDTVRVVDRCFLHGDIVGRTADPAGQTGTVVNVSIEVDVRWPHSGQTASGVDVKQLRHIAPIKTGSFVVKDKWLGRVEECMDTVYVRFADKSLCKITETSLDELEPVNPTPLLDEAHPYFPGQTVRGAQAFKRAHWIRGGKYKPSKHKQGQVVRVQPYMLAVLWVANQGMDMDASPDEEYVKVSDIEHLDHFSWTWWQVGDRGLLPQPCTETSAGEGDSDAAADTGGMPARRYDRKPGSRSRRRQSRQPGCHRAGVANGAGCTGQPKDQVHNCVEIVRSRTKVDVRWQDTTLTTNEPACELVPVLLDGNDFQPGDFVVEKGEEDPSAGVQAAGPLTRTGVVRSVNASERTCDVAWSKIEAGHPSTMGSGRANDRVDSSSSSTSVSGIVFGSGTDAVFSVYELVPHPDFSFRRGIPVLRLSTNSGTEGPAPTERGADTTTVVSTCEGANVHGSHAQSDGDAQSRQDADPSEPQPERCEPGAKDAAEAASAAAAEDDDDDHDDDGDSSDWETDEDEDGHETSVDASGTSNAPPMYGEVIEVCEDTAHVRVCWSDNTIQLCDPSSLFVVPDDDELDMLDEGQYDSDGGWETASDAGSEQADGTPGNQLNAVMQQWETQEAQQASIFGHTPSRGDATGPPDRSSETAPSAECTGNDASSATNDAASALPTCTADSPPSDSANVDVDVSSSPPSFDCIEGTFADHRFADRSGPATNARQFGRRVTKEWGLLSGNLPPGIYVSTLEPICGKKTYTMQNFSNGIDSEQVRACEAQMDLLRAVLFGPGGTPYEDSVFFFDILLPADYPNSPPEVSYFSYGERLNPNLYETGKVCLSLLGTWSGQAGENWSPKTSNILQVLISIQGLVLVEEPFYNEPGFEKQIGTEDGRGAVKTVKSMRYNEGALLFTIRALNRCFQSLPTQTEDICRYEFTARGPRLYKRLQDLLAAHPDPARPYGSAGFLRTLNKLLPSTEKSMRTFVGASYIHQASAVADKPNEHGEEQDQPQEEPISEPERLQEPQSSSDDDSDL